MESTDKSAAALDRPPAILIVEDEALIRAMLSDHLQDCGFKVLEAAHAAEAVTILSSGQTQIDVVVTDVRMPGEMNGFGLARWVRENRAGLPVIVVSGDAQKTDIASELCAGEAFFHKPYNVDTIASHIRAAIEKRAQAQ